MAKVIFLKNIKNVAQIGDVKEVSDGYARNYLFPNDMAKLATPEALGEAVELQKKRDIVLAEEKEEKKVNAEKLNSSTLTLERLTNEEGTLYDGIDAPEISNAMKDAGFNIDPEEINLEGHIKQIGEYTVEVNLDDDITANVKISVVKRAN